MSRPAALAEITTFLFTFSLFMALGPVEETTSATYESGSLFPSASSIIRSLMSSMEPRSDSAALTTRLKAFPCSYTCETVSPAMFTVTNSLNSGMEMPYFASISRFGMILISGLSICCSTFRSAMPSTPLIRSLISFPSRNILFRSSPNSLMAIPACVPLSMASIRWLIGWPISMLAPEMVESFSRTSASSSAWERSFSSNGASISDTFTPSACSSSSARPVLRATVCISGMESRSSSAWRPILSDSSSEIPGRELTFIVNDPSLNAGRKLCPRVKNSPRATQNSANVAPTTLFLCLITHSRAFL